MLRVTASERIMRKLHNKELHDVYLSRNTITVIASRMMGLVGRVEGMGEIRNPQNI